MIEGTLELMLDDGRIKLLNAGDALFEVVSLRRIATAQIPVLHKSGDDHACTLALNSRQVSHSRFELDLHTDIGQGPKNILGDK